VVFAAASLRDAFTSIQAGFTRAHPGAKVVFNFAGTQELRTQLEQGAEADVLAAADVRHMDDLRTAGRVEAPAIFARNELVVVVSREAAQTVRTFDALPNAARIVLGAPEAPIGRYAEQALDRARKVFGDDFRARVEAKVASRELNVRQVFAKVSLGEADAGIVYRSDVRAGERGVSVVTIPPEVNVVAEYPIATVARSAHAARAREWVAFVLSSEGQAALVDAGFRAASPGAPP
jgi:molybdate transport system substrate-binding protein